MNQSRVSIWFRLFWMFLKINFLSTSGPASVGLLYRESVDKKMMTEREFVEAVGFSNVLPGSEALKLAMFVGYSAGGFPGTLAALLGSVFPPAFMMLAVAAIVQKYQGEAWMQGFMDGLGPAVAALIVVVAWELFRAGSRKKIDRRVILIALLSAGAYWLAIPSPFVLLGAGLLGVMLYGRRSRT